MYLAKEMPKPQNHRAMKLKSMVRLAGVFFISGALCGGVVIVSNLFLEVGLLI